MKTRQRNLFLLFAITAMAMNFMAGITPLWLPDLDGEKIQICTTQGIETVTLDENGNEIPNAPAPSDHNCPFCLVQTHSPLALNTLHILPPVFEKSKNGHHEPHEILTANSRYNAHTPRAPPTLS